MPIDDRTEWLEADGLGGFASATTSGIRTRRYHGLLLTAMNPPTGRIVLVNGCDAWLDTPSGSCAVSTQRYAPDVLYPDGAAHVTGFCAWPLPRHRPVRRRARHPGRMGWSRVRRYVAKPVLRSR